jgi:hypothetical protein
MAGGTLNPKESDPSTLMTPVISLFRSDPSAGSPIRRQVTLIFKLQTFKIYSASFPPLRPLGSQSLHRIEKGRGLGFSIRNGPQEAIIWGTVDAGQLLTGCQEMVEEPHIS